MSGAVLEAPPAGGRTAPRAIDPLPSVTSRVGEPTWELAERLYPRQGEWSERQFRRVWERSPVPVDFDAGVLYFDADAERSSSRGEPTWEAAEFLHPRQGEWTEEEYLGAAGDCLGLVEFVDGRLEFLEMTDLPHALLVDWLMDRLKEHGRATGSGRPLTAPLSVRLWTGRNREPDVMYFPPDIGQAGRRYPTAEDVLLAVEVVSPSPESIRRDRRTKRTEYAAAGIPEYWVVDATDPADPFVLVLTLPDGADEYAEHGTFRPGEAGDSVRLPGFSVDIAALFAAGGIVDE